MRNAAAIAAKQERRARLEAELGRNSAPCQTGDMGHPRRSGVAV
jgi:hypothetical protein